jgi:two-component system sensor histidine kinase BaeS/two-component system sensor histidine kinase KdpD
VSLADASLVVAGMGVGAVGTLWAFLRRPGRRGAPEPAGGPEVSVHALRHELRTPLASVAALTAALDTDLAGPGTSLDEERRRELARLARWQAEHMATIVNGASAHPADGHRALDLVCTAAALAAGVPRARCVTRLDCRVARLPVRPDLVQRLLTNLLENAVRHGPADGAVWLTAWCDGDELVLRVADAGRVTAELRRAVAGRAPGLGLRIVRSLLAEAGGRLALRADEPGVVLEVRLPGYVPRRDR